MYALAVCIDEKVTIPNVLREALIDDIHSSHAGTWGMIFMATHCWWPYMHRELIVKATEGKPCTVIGKNLKSVIPAKQFHPHIPCVEPNQEIQIDISWNIHGLFDWIRKNVWLAIKLRPSVTKIILI